MSEMQPRITGTEMEWAIEVQPEEGADFRQAHVEEMNATIDARHFDLLRAENGHMMSNGSRMYVDVGAHLEYATPEATSFVETVAHEIAGENIVHDSVQVLKNEGVFHDVIVSKRVVDDELHTWGYHTSFCCDASRLDVGIKQLMPLGLHLATHNVFGGAGAIVKSGNHVRFVLAQKVLNLNHDFAESSHGQNSAPQPLISLRQEALADEEKYSRIHITSMDASMSPWSTWMKLGTTSIVLGMMERGYLENNINFEDDMHQVAIDVAFDSSLSRPLKLEDGRSVLALDVQEALILRAQKMAAREGLNPEEQTVLEEWQRAISDLRTDPELLFDRSEWVAKRRVLRHYMAKHAINDIANEMVIKKERQWSHLGEYGIAERLRESSWAKWMPSKESIDRAYFEPPTDTRAMTRSQLIRSSLEAGGNPRASWNSLYLPEDQLKITMDDPYSLEYETERVLKTVEEMSDDYEE